MPKLTATDRLTVVGTISRKQAAQLIQQIASALGSDEEIQFRIDNVARWDGDEADSNLLLNIGGGFGSELVVVDSAVIMGGE